MADDQESAFEAFTTTADTLARSLDFVWLFACLALVVLMQAGFAAYEVREKNNTTTITLFGKNNFYTLTRS